MLLVVSCALIILSISSLVPTSIQSIRIIPSNYLRYRCHTRRNPTSSDCHWQRKNTRKTSIERAKDPLTLHLHSYIDTVNSRRRGSLYCNYSYNMDSSSSSSTSTATKSTSIEELTKDQLRFKRLIALGIQNPIPITFIPNSNNEPQRTDALVSNSNQNDLVDLMDDSSDDDADADVESKHDDNDEVDDDDDNNDKKRRYETPPKSIESPLSSYINNNNNRKQPPNRPYRYKNDDDDNYDNENQRPIKVMMNQRSTDSHIPNDTINITAMSKTNDNTMSNHNGTVSFQVATWNVWFGPWGDGNPHSTVRMKAILNILKEQHHLHNNDNNNENTNSNPLWCIGFQEVVHETIQPLKASLIKQNYYWYEQPSRTVPYKCAMAIHSDLIILEQGWIPYTQTVMQRGFLYVRAKLPSYKPTTTSTSATETLEENDDSEQIIFTTTHLESFNGKDYNGAPQRLHQIQEMCSFVHEQIQLYPTIRLSILSGDMNWDDERIVRSSNTKCIDPILLSSIPSYWKDTWLEANNISDTTSSTEYIKGKGKVTKKNIVEGYTYDSKLNPMLGGSLRRRFDRILVLQNTNDNNNTNDKKLHIKTPQLLGMEAINDLTWEKYNSYTRTTKIVPTAPSDHFGYIVTLCLD